MSTKFFACLELVEARKVAEAANTLHLPAHSLLFHAGDDGAAGIYVVVNGSVGMFLADGDKLVQTNTLRPGESVGDLDVIDGERPTCALSTAAAPVHAWRPAPLHCTPLRVPPVATLTCGAACRRAAQHHMHGAGGWRRTAAGAA
jgi:CRP-like cAMP-binding protein